MESRSRTILKALTWRVGGTLVTFGVTWTLTGRMAVAAAVGMGDSLFKIVAYYVHERAWQRIGFGQSKAPEYHI